MQPTELMKKIKIIGKILYGLVFAGLIIIAGLVAVSIFNIPGNYKLLVVQSGSMEPAVRKGALVITKPQNDYFKGDIITVADTNPKESVTHRIFGIEETAGQTSYITKGDANNAPDGEKRPKNKVLGKVLFSVPFLGYPVSFAKTLYGLILLVLIPAVLIILGEAVTIKNETKRLLLERKKRKLSLTEKVEEKIGEEIIEVEKRVKKII